MTDYKVSNKNNISVFDDEKCKKKEREEISYFFYCVASNATHVIAVQHNVFVQVFSNEHHITSYST